MEGCLEKPFKALISEILYPIYDYETQKKFGHYADASTHLEVTDCKFNGSFNFDYDETLKFSFASQIRMQGNSNSSTGGTGAYECASGTAGEYFTSMFSVCDVCA
jgi:hypothetical protein